MQGQPNFATFLGGNGNIGLESRRLASMAREVRIAESAVFIYSFMHCRFIVPRQARDTQNTR
jgi:hypothetical protein